MPILAVHQASEKGQNKYQIYSENMNIETYKRFHLKNDLQKAVNNGEFYVEYQPKIETKTNKIIGTEALVHFPKWGIVSPDEFISLAEENGFITTLGKMVLWDACQQNKAFGNFKDYHQLKYQSIFRHCNFYKQI